MKFKGVKGKFLTVRFWKHVFDQPGEQGEEAVNCVVKAFKWRKEFGVDMIDEKNINMSVVNRGFLFSHNRDKVLLSSWKILFGLPSFRMDVNL